MPKPIEAILIGAGLRGAEAYASYALEHPDELRFVAVAEPIEARRLRFAALHGIPPERQFTSWEDLLALPRLGEAALICTMDTLHTEPTLAALSRGYHILLEKPMATTPQECVQLVEASEAAGLQLHICHVLRYTNHFSTMRDVIRSGVLGEIVDVAHRENVGFWHMAHSYVRGNWRNSQLSSPMILAKCSHDFDLLLWLMDCDCRSLSSFGSLMHFRPENAPPGAPLRCLDGCPVADTCIYYAPWIYQELTPFWRSYADTSSGIAAEIVRSYTERPAFVRALSLIIPDVRQVTEYSGWPLNVLHPDPTPENIDRALREGPYGRCVYHCDNNVVDHQTVAMEFQSGASVTLTMHGHSHVEYRTTRIEGTRGRLMAQIGNGGAHIVVDQHRSNERTRYDTSAQEHAGHGGGDIALMRSFLHSIRSDSSAARTTARQSLRSHLLAFAAEQARLERRVIDTENLP